MYKRFSVYGIFQNKTYLSQSFRNTKRTQKVSDKILLFVTREITFNSAIEIGRYIYGSRLLACFMILLTFPFNQTPFP